MTEDEPMTETIAPWDDARTHASKLEKALLECAYREGSCHGDWSEKSIKWQSLHNLAEQIVTGLNELLA
jgi:hypothetical protein